MRRFIPLLISLALATSIFAQKNNWEVSPYTTTETEQVQQSEIQPEAVPAKSRHNISVEYGMLNFSDFLWAIASAIGGMFSDEENDTIFLLGDIGINYGYEVGEVFETGVIFNFAMPDKRLALFTIMPRAKLNFNSNGFINPYMELDAGIMISSSGGAMPMLHGTLFGLEIGHFYFQVLGWGQRGLFYAGIRTPF